MHKELERREVLKDINPQDYFCAVGCVYYAGGTVGPCGNVGKTGGHNAETERPCVMLFGRPKPHAAFP